VRNVTTAANWQPYAGSLPPHWEQATKCMRVMLLGFMRYRLTPMPERVAPPVIAAFAPSVRSMGTLHGAAVAAGIVGVCPPHVH
jgi:hypothetical protein